MTKQEEYTFDLGIFIIMNVDDDTRIYTEYKEESDRIHIYFDNGTKGELTIPFSEKLGQPDTLKQVAELLGKNINKLTGVQKDI